MKHNKDLSLGEKHAFDGYKLIVVQSDGVTELFPISEKVFEALKKYGIPRQG